MGADVLRTFWRQIHTATLRHPPTWKNVSPNQKGRIRRRPPPLGNERLLNPFYPICCRDLLLLTPSSEGPSGVAPPLNRLSSPPFAVMMAKEKPPITVVGDVGGRIAIIVVRHRSRLVLPGRPQLLLA